MLFDAQLVMKESLRVNFEDAPKVAEIAPPDLAEQSEKRIFVLSVFPPMIDSVPFSPKSTQRAPPFPLVDEHEVKEVRWLSDWVMLSVCSSVNSAWMTAPSPSERLMNPKWQSVIVADASLRVMREAETVAGVYVSSSSCWVGVTVTVMLVRMAVPAVAFRRGDAAD